MTTFVLVHGAWHGSWCWKRVRKALQAEGHEVFTPTLTGVAERSHLDLSAGQSRHPRRRRRESDPLGRAHGRRALRPLVWRLRDHGRRGSHSRAAARARLSRCVHPRERPVAARRVAARGRRRTGPRHERDGRRLARAADLRRVFPSQRRGSRLGGPSVHAAAARDVPATAARRRIFPASKCTHILATGYEHSPFPPFHEIAKRKGWKTSTIDCGHDVMLDRPTELVSMLRNAAH